MLSGNPNSQIGESVGELKQLIASEVRLLEENLEYQRQFEHEASLKVNVLGTGLRNKEADCFLNVTIQVDLLKLGCLFVLFVGMTITFPFFSFPP